MGFIEGDDDIDAIGPESTQYGGRQKTIEAEQPCFYALHDVAHLSKAFIRCISAARYPFL